MRKALPWNNLPSWRELPAEQKRRARAFALGGAAGILAAALIAALPRLIADFQDRGRQRGVMAPWVEQARRLDLGYDAILADPAAHAGRPVVWCVDHPAVGTSYFSGRPSRPLVWTNEGDLPINSPTSGGRCTTVLAIVEGAGRAGVRLRYAGTP